ncbi:MAG: radical SAM family heme chaperone HemW [Elainellaceae cyanobacterium]
MATTQSSAPSQGLTPVDSSVASPTAAYVHIPFCRRRCYYCDFAVSIVGNRPPVAITSELAPEQTDGHGSQAIAAYLDVLCEEIEATPKGPPLQTLFFGGGTPSLLSSQQLERLLAVLARQFGIAQGAEISIEVDPDTVRDGMLARYREMGINRVSLGVQAFQDELLTACGRTHRRRHIDYALGQLHRAGLTNVSLDLISGLPHQTLDQWTESLQRAIATGVPHLSVYDLIVEPQTAFSRWYSPGEHPLPSDTATVQMYRQAQALLTQAGYEHYEISNYAKPGFQCRHNRVYWENRPFYGFGMGAASYIQQQRVTRPRTQVAYRAWVRDRLSQRTACPDSLTERLLDTLMLGLRLSEGLSLRKLVRAFGSDLVHGVTRAMAPFYAKGWVIYGPDDRFRLSDPDGFLFSNVILSTLFDTVSAASDSDADDLPD